MRLLDLPAWLRSYGLTVEEVHGWQTRGAELRSTPTVVVGHHTATSARAKGDLPTLGILRDGRPDLPGPLCQIGLGRNGTAYVLASGKANHAGRGQWGGTTNSALTVGIEVEHPGTGPWTPLQLDAFDRTAAALLAGLGRTADDYCGHREWARPVGRKVDPGGVDLDAQRQRIRDLLNQPHRTEPDVTDDDIEKVAKRVVELLKGTVATREDMRTLLRGTPTHPHNLTSISQKVDRLLEAGQ